MALCAAPGLYRLAVQFQVGDNFNWLQQVPLRNS